MLREVTPLHLFVVDSPSPINCSNVIVSAYPFKIIKIAFLFDMSCIYRGLAMNHYGTLSALHSLLISMGIVMHRCRRRFGDEPHYYLENANHEVVSPDTPNKVFRRGYTLAEILNWLDLKAGCPVANDAHNLLIQLDSDEQAS